MTTDLKEITEDMAKAINRAKIELALRIHSNLIMTTPVDTGFARSNWVISVGTPIQELPGNNQIVLQEKSMEVTDPIYISNNTPYIGYLNEGSSRQAPAGFVNVAIHKAIASLLGERLS